MFFRLGSRILSKGVLTSSKNCMFNNYKQNIIHSLYNFIPLFFSFYIIEIQGAGVKPPIASPLLDTSMISIINFVLSILQEATRTSICQQRRFLDSVRFLNRKRTDLDYMKDAEVFRRPITGHQTAPEQSNISYLMTEKIKRIQILHQILYILHN